MDELQLLQHQISLQQRGGRGGGGVGANNPTVFSDLTSSNPSKRPAAVALQHSSVTSKSGTVLAMPPAALQDLEIDAIVSLHTERLRNEVREVTKRHCRGLLSAAEREAARRLREKAVELEVARLTNAALEEKVRKLTAENQMRLAAAKHYEAAVGVLRGSLQRALLLQQSRSRSSAGCCEGYGDSEAISAAESSCCFEAEEKGRGQQQQQRRRRRSGWWCKACGRKEARTLLLPCKHLCLCEECEPGVGECPVCGAAKTAGFQVFTC
ncbi:probable BOI-related E3 ubiquitin-protein ligase 2 [Zingiber officinale]|uniref:probable BOI-related E3 ubiquitin-protein ligase 2 n=1 Tax=Zingiber officinale TaxID=94328 RepID=UPI001C4D8ABD|nr:probable BOI-related E3 ubiquitin-protein ligase 2 [Zingiber officinale]